MALYDVYTKSLLHFNGANGSTTFTDEIGKVWTASGTAQLSTSFPEFGSACGYFDGGDTCFISTPNNEDFNVGSNDFTIDFWMKILPGSETGVIFYQGDPSGNAFSVGHLIECYTSGVITWSPDYVSYPSQHQINATLPDNNWHHIACVRSGTTFTIYLDGIAQNSATISGSMSASSFPEYLAGFGLPAQSIHTYIDEFRFSNGIARWTANFVPPVQEYQPLLSGLIQGTVVSWDMDFGDGAPHGDISSATHTYNITHPVMYSLTVVDSLDATASLKFPIEISDTYYFNFGDGTVQLYQGDSSIVHTYNQTSLTRLVDSLGDVAYSQQIQIIGLTADFSADTQFGYNSLLVHFTDLSQGNPITWSWDFGNGQTSTSQTPMAQPYLPGTYTVTLTVFDGISFNTVVKTAFIEVLSTVASARYYVGAGSSSWDSTNSWSMTSGGPSGASIPSMVNSVIFDRTGYGACTMHSPVSIAGLTMGSSDTTINQNNSSLFISNTLSVIKGYFNGSGQNISVQGGAIIGSSCTFKNTDATLQLYADSTLGAGFIDHAGTVAIYSGTHFSSDAPLYNLEILQVPIATPIVVNNTCVVGHALTLAAGYVQRGTDSSISVLGDLYIQQEFGSFDSRNNALITMDGTTVQNIFNQGGGIIPSLTVNNDSTFQMKCWGASPILINGDFNLQDGTFNTQGIDLQVGI